MTTIELLQIIAKENKKIEAFSFHTFPKQELIQERIVAWGDEEEAMFNYAIDMRSRYNVPFWEGIMLSTFGNGDVSKEVLKQALNHNDKTDLFFIPVANINVNDLLTYDRLAVCSLVKNNNGTISHLPMIDFHIPISETNLKVVEDVCRILSLNQGWIIDSGESYHYLGSQLLEWGALNNILLKAALFDPIVDKNWICHQLIERSCSLRLGKKHSVLPKVVLSI